MKAVIFLNGSYNYNIDFLKELINDKMHIYCADGGADYCIKNGFVPDCIYGDLDSISPEILDKVENLGIKVKKYSVDKDYSDFELVLKEIDYARYKLIYVLGALGKRIDFTLNNIFLMEKYKNLTILSENEKIYIRDKSFTIENEYGKTVSMISMDSEITGLTLRGFKFPLMNRNIRRGSSILMSNVIIQKEAEVIFEKGKVIVILNK